MYLPLVYTTLLIFCVFGNYLWLEQVLRQETLISGCNRGNVPRKKLLKSQLDHILVDHRHSLLYCYVPKVACTNWKRVFMVFTGTAANLSLGEIPGSVAHADNSTLKLSQLPTKQIQKLLANYTSFVMVRHPFERLLSAYRNKFEQTYSEYFQKRYGRNIIKKYRHNPTEGELETGKNVTFREFIQFILDEGLQTNEHWASIYQLCHPCSLNYSFIGRYETLAEDARAILDLISMPMVTFPVTKSSNTSQMLRQYFQQLSMKEIEQLYRLYELDFRLFGYDLEALLGYDLS